MSVPHPHTVRRLLVQLDGDALDKRSEPSSPPRRSRARRTAGDRRRRQALRGSRTATAPRVTLLAAMGHPGSVLAQWQITDKSNEIPAFDPLLDTIDLTGTVITADALHTQHAHGAYLRERGAHYLAR